jgi:hypothetical protein
MTNSKSTTGKMKMIDIVSEMNGIVVGLLLGAGVCGHLLRLVTLGWPHVLVPAARFHIAFFAIMIYGIATLLVLQGNVIGHLMTLCFPFVGLTAVMITKQKVDIFQIVLGIFQLLASLISLYFVIGALS